MELTKLQSPPPVNDEQYRSLVGQRALKVGEMSAKKRRQPRLLLFLLLLLVDLDFVVDEHDEDADVPDTPRSMVLVKKSPAKVGISPEFLELYDFAPKSSNDYDYRL